MTNLASNDEVIALDELFLRGQEAFRAVAMGELRKAVVAARRSVRSASVKDKRIAQERYLTLAGLIGSLSGLAPAATPRALRGKHTRSAAPAKARHGNTRSPRPQMIAPFTSAPPMITHTEAPEAEASAATVEFWAAIKEFDQQAAARRRARRSQSSRSRSRALQH